MEYMNVLKLGGEGGSVAILEKDLNGKTVYLLNTNEFVDDEDPYSSSEKFGSLESAWKALTEQYRYWHFLFPLHISNEILPLVRQSLADKELEEGYRREAWNSFGAL